MMLDTEFNSAAQVPARECLEGAVLAERRGFGCVWKGESNSRDPIVLLSAMAAQTTRLELGTAIYHMFGRSPVSMGIQAATFNDLSQGRLILGLGIANPTIAGWHGYEFNRPVRQLREYVEVIRRVYSGDRTEYSGDFYRVSGFKLAFEPPPYPLRIWLAALGPQMTRLAGRVSDGIVINLANPPMIRQIVAGFRDAALEAGRDPDQLQVVSKVRVSIHPDIDQARRALKKVLTFYTLAYGYRTLLGRMGWGSVVESVQRAHRQSGFHSAREQIPDEMLESVPTVAATSIDAVTARLAEYQAAGSTRCVVAYVVSGEDTWGEIRAFIDQMDVNPIAA